MTKLSKCCSAPIINGHTEYKEWTKCSKCGNDCDTIEPKEEGKPKMIRLYCLYCGQGKDFDENSSIGNGTLNFFCNGDCEDRYAFSDRPSKDYKQREPKTLTPNDWIEEKKKGIMGYFKAILNDTFVGLPETPNDLRTVELTMKKFEGLVDNYAQSLTQQKEAIEKESNWIVCEIFGESGRTTDGKQLYRAKVRRKD